MDTAAVYLSLLSLLVLVSILSSLIVPRLGIPVLLIYLVFGMLAGEQGPGQIVYDDVSSAYFIGSAALAVILFDGGLRTDLSSFRVGLRPAFSLATVGVLISAGITALAAHFVLGIGWIEAMLMGAIVGSTDAAAVFSVLRGQGMSLQQRVGATLEIESGANDPMAVFLTVILVNAVLIGAAPGWDAIGYFAWQMGLGAGAGGLAGLALAWSVTHLRLGAALYPLLVLFGAWLLFGIVALFDGSGFLAVYVAGLVLASRVSRGLYNVEKFLDGIAWLAQIVMFLMLGLLVTPGDLLPMALDALMVGLVLMIVARPVAVIFCLLPFRFSWRENLFVSWVGLRGAVPIILALFPWMAGLPNHQVYFNVAFFVVLLSLLLQGWTVAPVARWLGLEVPSRKTRLQRIELGMPGQENSVGQLPDFGQQPPARPCSVRDQWPGSALRSW
ncbi:MAG: potassium/proton antiporter [Burkholderiaceae bacterium]